MLSLIAVTLIAVVVITMRRGANRPVAVTVSVSSTQVQQHSEQHSEKSLFGRSAKGTRSNTNAAMQSAEPPDPISERSAADAAVNAADAAAALAASASAS